MDKVFMEMFSKRPDEIIDGDYYYHLPYHDDWTAAATKMLGISPEEHKEMRERAKSNIRQDFKLRWEKKALDGEIDYFWDEPWIKIFKGENKDLKVFDMIRKIASEGNPFMDIASSESMGFAPYLIKMNPEIPCLVTDIDATIVKNLRSCIDEFLPEYNISLASFDNLDMPLRDNSLDCITGVYGISSSSGMIPSDNAKININQYSAGREKPISEVYRVLKPGGRFITIETNMECDFDLRKVYDHYNKNGSLFGIYAFDEIQAVLDLLTEEPWRDKFTSAGFEAEVEKKLYKKYSLGQVMSFLHVFTSDHNIRHWGKKTWREQRQTEKSWIYTDEAKKAEDIGIDFYGVDVFYVLRKPD